jgi:chromosome segregation ATPase
VKGAEGNAGDAGEEVMQPDAKATEILNRSPVSKEAQDLRDAARKAQKDYFAARAESPQIRNIERQIVKRIEDARALQAQQRTIAATDSTLKALKETCDEAASAVKTAKGDATRTALANAKKAQEAFVAARANNGEIRALETQIAAIKTETDTLRAQQDTIVAADPNLQQFKNAWMQAVEAVRKQSPGRPDHAASLR